MYNNQNNMNNTIKTTQLHFKVKTKVIKDKKSINIPHKVYMF